MHSKLYLAAAGAAAGAVTGLLGAGGGMILVPLLVLSGGLEEREIFPASLSVMLPVCLVSLILLSGNMVLPWQQAAPYLTGAAVGGVLAGILGKHIPVLWLHRGLGILILWGGIRYLWQNP